MLPAEERETAIIGIDVLRERQDSLLSGTFKEPYPLVRVRRDTLVQWRLKKADERDSFIVSFPNGSPFEGISAISDRTGPLPAVRKGSFHYQVFVVPAGAREVYVIQRCPEIQIDTGDSD